MASPDRARARKLLWFAGLWLASVCALGVVAFALRSILKLAGS